MSSSLPVAVPGQYALSSPTAMAGDLASLSYSAGFIERVASSRCLEAERPLSAN